ncbi:MAG TPA: DEAD/DEAH box helicase [Patescibacteria group bacterium]|nr:DEAD/DEAH box helicase [Patescibacteria group bacterium]
MKITIANRIRVRDPGVLKEVIMNELRMENPKYESAVSNGRSTFKIPPTLFNFSILPDDSLSVPRGYLKRLQQLLVDFNIKDYTIEDERFMGPFNFDIDSSNIKLRDYQMKAITNLISNGTEGLLLAPAGSGKTVMGVSLIPMLGQQMLWLTHTKPLMNQVIERVQSFLPCLGKEDIGTIGSGKWDVGKVFTAAMVQTLVRNPIETYKLKNQFGIVVLDECHHLPCTTFTQVVGSLNPYYLYGLTATHLRRDGMHKLMFQTMGPILHTVPLADVKKGGNIIVPQIHCRHINCVSIHAPDFGNILTELANDECRNNLIVKDIVNEATQGNICVVITERRNHADILFNKISKQWPKTGIATGSYSSKDNKTTLELLRDAKISVLVTTSALLGEGFDHAPINRGFICLPFRNMVKTEQVIGRIQRSAKDKDDAIIYDYIDKHSLLEHQFKNNGSYGCRHNIYIKLGCRIRVA